MKDYSKALPDTIIMNIGTFDNDLADYLLLTISPSNCVSITHVVSFTERANKHKRILQYVLHNGPGVIDMEVARADLQKGGKIARLLDRIIRGRSLKQQGSELVSVLTDDASDADQELVRLIQTGYFLRWHDKDWHNWDEWDWISPAAQDFMSGDKTDDEVIDFLERNRIVAERQKINLYGDATKRLLEMRDSLQLA